MEDKTIIGIIGLICVTIIQCVAWYLGFDGQVFALTSAVIGVIIGYFFGWSKNVQTTITEYIEKNKTG